ncbi:ribitol kinase [Moniliophthora roreri]|nr:ribitol kinase [Moniliophthora roreri]
MNHYDPPQSVYIGVDVGTGSARAMLVTKDGTTIASSTKDTTTFRDPKNHSTYEQSTNDIWAAISQCVKDCLSSSKTPPSNVKGISFDATCSLAVCDFSGNPVVVTDGEQLGELGDRNVILWADHRAEKEADFIDAMANGCAVLDFIGGRMTVEMEVPRILWLKKHMDPKLFEQCQFFNLPDFLTYRATQDSTRSCCSVTCACSFVPERGWIDEYFEKIGLEEFPRNGYKQMGAANGNVLTAGMPVGRGLSKKAADELGLLGGTPVGSGVIDGYGGWLGTVAGRYTSDGKLSEAVKDVEESQHRLAAVAGTSTCLIVQSKKGAFVKGLWGPWKDIIFPGWAMNEGGQPATGQASSLNISMNLIDFMIKTHPSYPRLLEIAQAQRTSIYKVLWDTLRKLQNEANVDSLTELTKDMHFYPDLHGNRSPIADSRMRGAIFGLTLDDSLQDLAQKYYLSLSSIALQTRHVIDELNASGHSINTIYVSGGQAKNPLMMQLLADTCYMPVILPYDHTNTVVLGAAVLARFAAEVVETMTEREQNDLLWNIMVEMTPPGRILPPSASERQRNLLEAKYVIFKEQIVIQQRWRREMAEALEE